MFHVWFTLFGFRLKLYHGTPRALLHPLFQDPVESKQQRDTSITPFVAVFVIQIGIVFVCWRQKVHGLCPRSAKQKRAFSFQALELQGGFQYHGKKKKKEHESDLMKK